MQAIELNTKIQANGLINLPENYQRWFGKSARLILLESTESVPPESKVTKDTKLAENTADKILALRKWLATLPDVPEIPLEFLDREELYR